MGPNPGLVTWISEIWYLLLPNRDMTKGLLKQLKILKTTEPTLQAYNLTRVIRDNCCPVILAEDGWQHADVEFWVTGWSYLHSHSNSGILSAIGKYLR